MDPSYRLTPATKGKTATVADTANSFGLHDSLRYGPRSLAVESTATNGIESRLENWEETQDALKLTLQRNVYGMHAPMRLLMERKIVAQGSHMPAFGRSNLHMDILMGRDESLDTGDFMGAPGPAMGTASDFHSEMEKKLRM